MATTLPMVAPFNAFPFCSPQGPLQAHCAKSSKPSLLFPIPLSTSELVPRYKKQKVSNFSIPFCFVVLRRGRDSNGVSRRADTAENITQTVGQAINRNHIGSTPVLDKKCRAIRNNAERAEGVLLWGCGECLHSQTDTKKQNG